MFNAALCYASRGAIGMNVMHSICCVIMAFLLFFNNGIKTSVGFANIMPMKYCKQKIIRLLVNTNSTNNETISYHILLKDNLK